MFLALCSPAVIFLSHCVGSDSQIHGNMDVTALRGQTQRAGGCYICKGSNEAGGDVKFYFHPLMLELSCKSNQTRACLGGCAAARTIPEHPPNIFFTFSLHFASSLPCTKRIPESSWRGIVNLVFFPAPINLTPGFNHGSLPGHRSHPAKSPSQTKHPLLQGSCGGEGKVPGGAGQSPGVTEVLPAHFPHCAGNVNADK